jgi:PIN domain nuclease of toxin-antitoxin system
MNIILDTHIFLWLISEDEHLSEDKAQAIIVILTIRFS